MGEDGYKLIIGIGDEMLPVVDRAVTNLACKNRLDYMDGVRKRVYDMIGEDARRNKEGIIRESGRVIVG